MAAQPEGCREQLLETARAKEGPAEDSGCKSLPSPPASVPCSQNMFSERGITPRASGCLKSLFSRGKKSGLIVKTRTEQKVWPAVPANAKVSAQPWSQPGLMSQSFGAAEQSPGEVGTSQSWSLGCSVIPVAPAAFPPEPGASPTCAGSLLL